MIVWTKVGAILASVLLVFCLGFHFGGVGPKLAAAQALEKLQAAEQKKTDVDETTIANEAKAYEAASIDPIPAPIVRLCYAAPTATVPDASTAGPRAHAPVSSAGANPVLGQTGPDIGPALLRTAHLADAQVTELQDYIHKVCLAEK